jgi:hypothetical protein
MAGIPKAPTWSLPHFTNKPWWGGCSIGMDAPLSKKIRGAISKCVSHDSRRRQAIATANLGFPRVHRRSTRRWHPASCLGVRGAELRTPRVLPRPGPILAEASPLNGASDGGRSVPRSAGGRGVIKLFTRCPHLAEHLLNLRARNEADGKRFSLFNHIFVGTAGEAVVTEDYRASYRLRTAKEL